MSSIYDKSSLVLIPSGTKTSKVYSQKPTNGDGDFDFTRSTAATRVNADGDIEKETSNLLTYSNDFSNSAWTKVRSSLSSGVSDPFGGSNAWAFLTDTTADEQHYFSQSISQSGVGTLSIYAKANGYNWLRLRLPSEEAFFDLANGVTGSSTTGISASITNAGSGWYRCEVAIANMSTNPNVFIHIAEGDGDIFIGGTPSGTDGLYIYAAQLNQGLIAQEVITTTTTALYGGITDNVPRLDYTDSSCPALLLEPQRTNSIIQSDYFAASSWTNNEGTTLTANAIVSPEGVQNAFKLVPDATNAHHRIFTLGSITAGNPYTYSVFAKKGEYRYMLLRENGLASNSQDNIGVDLETGTITYASSNYTSYDIEDYGNDWYRISASANAALSSYTIGVRFQNYETTDNGISTFTGNGTSGGYVYGFQVEAGSYPTSYIPTYGTSVSRINDRSVKTGISDLIGQTEGTLFIESSALSNNYPSDSWYSISDETAANRIMIGYYRNPNIIRFYATFQGTNVLDTTVNVGDISDVKKIAIAYASNDIVAYVNGSNILTDTNTSSLVPNNLSKYGFENEGGTYPLYAKVNQSLLFKTRLTNAELATLTTI